MDYFFRGTLGQNFEVYVDDIVVKSDSCWQHIKDLQEVCKALHNHGMKLNPNKCASGVERGKFLGFMVTHRDIEANHEKCTAITEMRNPENVKEFQRLVERLTAYLDLYRS